MLTFVDDKDEDDDDVVDDIIGKNNKTTTGKIKVRFSEMTSNLPNQEFDIKKLTVEHHSITQSFFSKHYSGD